MDGSMRRGLTDLYLAAQVAALFSLSHPFHQFLVQQILHLFLQQFHFLF